MITLLGDNIVCSLGFSSEEVYASVCEGGSGIKRYESRFDLPQPFMASLIDEQTLNEDFESLRGGSYCEYTKFEKAIILSASKAIDRSGIDASLKSVLFILSTTKGNVDLLENEQNSLEHAKLWHSAKKLAMWFGNENEPMVVSNACISGVCAQITAQRMIECGKYDTAVVVGGDMLSKFVISGFQSFKALSESECKPFDSARTGLNLGEAAATIVYSASEKGSAKMICGAIRNDANHISGPSRTAEGLKNALEPILNVCSKDRIAFINAHGTATLYNDEMESIALSSMGLSEVPINSLKAIFGHTLGAAGILETIISKYALEERIILPSRGFETIGVSCPINVSDKVRNIEDEKKDCFIKMLSGFGGSNAAMVMEVGR